MDENSIKILELLNKAKLSEEEKSFLNELIEKDEEARAFNKLHNQVKEVVRHSSHISEENLANYILLKNNIHSESILLQSDLTTIENHLKECERCNSTFNELSQEYENIDNMLATQFSETHTTSKVKEKKQRRFFPNISPFRNRGFVKYAFASVIIIAALYVSLIFISNFSTPGTVNLARVNDNSLFYVTRGREGGEFQKGLAYLEDKDFQNAIKSFEQDIKTDKDRETIFYAHYILGLTYLVASGKTILGLFPSYDEQTVNKAIKSLKDCVSENTSGRFPDITLNSYFYLAKANLMLDRISKAKEYLQKVIAGKGSKMGEAGKLLRKL